MTDQTRFKKLLEAGYFGKVRTRNRMIKVAGSTSYGNKDATVTETMKDFYEAIAKGGVGLIIVENTTVDWPRGAHRPSATLALSDDRFIKGLSEVTGVIHKYGCPVFIQMMHSGAWYPTKEMPERVPVSPSALTASELPGGGFAPPREPSIDEIQELIGMFASAAERAQKAGFDGVEVNGASQHLINAFFSRIWNRRHDKYGCDTIENRARFMVETIREIKKRLGQDYPVEVLINGAEYGHERATTPAEAQQYAQLIEKAGADVIQVRTHGYLDLFGMLHVDRFFYPELEKERMVKPLDWSRKGVGIVVPLATGIKKLVSIPVFCASRLDPIVGEEYLRQGKLDFIGMTRRLLADHELPNKVIEGRLEDITPCAGCLHCWDLRGQNKPIRCRVNSTLGMERAYQIKPAEKKKKVVVVGGGPAGMEAARIAALRGHEVILYEKEFILGGLMPIAAVVKDLEINVIMDHVRWLKTQMKKAGVTVRTRKELHSQEILQIKPDVVILAIGGLATLPAIPGIKRRNVLDLTKLDFMMRLMGPKLTAFLGKIWMPIGKRVVVIGGAMHGCELAELLTKTGRKATIVDTLATMGKGLTGDDQDRLFKWFDKKGVVRITGVKYEEITDKGLVITTKDGEKKTLEANTVMPALLLVPNTDFAKSLEGKVPEIYTIGNAMEPEPGRIVEATADGARIAHAI